MAYKSPSPSLTPALNASTRRARLYLATQRKLQQATAQESRTKWDLLHRAIEDPAKRKAGQTLARLARARIQHKAQFQKMLRVRPSTPLTVF